MKRYVTVGDFLLLYPSCKTLSPTISDDNGVERDADGHNILETNRNVSAVITITLTQ